MCCVVFLFSLTGRALTEANAKHSHVREAAANVSKRFVEGKGRDRRERVRERRVVV